jgi:hypothetical protein
MQTVATLYFLRNNDDRKVKTGSVQIQYFFSTTLVPQLVESMDAEPICGEPTHEEKMWWPLEMSSEGKKDTRGIGNQDPAAMQKETRMFLICMTQCY